MPDSYAVPLATLSTRGPSTALAMMFTAAKTAAITKSRAIGAYEMTPMSAGDGMEAGV